MNKVQEILDPVPYHQQGVGAAPIGHYVTVEGVKAKNIAVHVKVTMKDDYTLESVKASISETISTYFAEVNKDWPNTQTVKTSEFSDEGLIFRRAPLESLLLDIPRIFDVEGLTLNGESRNLQLKPGELGVLGAVTYE